MNKWINSLLVVMVTWTSVVSAGEIWSSKDSPDAPIPDNGGGSGNFGTMYIDLSGAPTGAKISGVTARGVAIHPYKGDLKMWVTYQDTGGAWHDYTIHDRTGESADNVDVTVTNVHHWDGASPNQRWYLSAGDYASGDTGVVDYFEIHVYYDTTPASAPSLTSPADGATVYANVAQIFQCGTVSGATGYKIQFDGSGYNVMDGSRQFSLTTSTAGAHTWRCCATNVAGDGPWSGTRSFTVTAATPEITVLDGGAYNFIADGDTTPTPSDGTDFGTITQGGSAVSVAFKVRNDGSSTLTLGTVSVPAGFTLSEGLSTSLAPGASDTFTVRLDSTTAGTKTGDISFSNNDSNENPYNFRITGTVNTPPEITVLDGGSSYVIADGDTTPSPSDGTDFGTITQGSSTASVAFKVRNDGSSTLTLGTVSVPAGFTLTEPLSTSLAPGASDTFTVRLDNTPAGTKTGDISFSNNDSNENPFNFRITGKVNASGGTLNVTVKQLGGTNQVGAIVMRYTNGWGYLDQKTTDAGGVASWSGVPAGIYIAEAYRYNSTHSTNEFWGGVTGIVVPAGGTTNVTIQRHMPYASDYRIFNGSTDVTGGSVPAGTLVTIKAAIRNPGTAGYNCRSVVWLDRTSVGGTDFNQTAGASLVNAGVTVTQTFSYTVSSTGVYSRTMQVQTDISGYKPTDTWDWQPVLTVDAAPPEISVYGAGGYVMTDGDTTPIPNDGTDYGTITEGGSTASGTFEVRNDGSSTLTLGTVNVPTGFTLTEPLSTSLAPGASDTFTVRLDNTPAGTKTGDISFSNNDSNENPFNFRITGKVNASGGTLNVTVKQLGGTNQVGAIVMRYTNGWGYLDQKTTDAGGVASWSGVPAGIYIAEAYRYNSTHSTNEFWGGVTGIVVPAGGTTNVTIQRHMPYASDYRIFNGSTDVTGGSVPAGTLVTIKAAIRNPGTAGYNCRSVVWLDRTSVGGTDFNQTAGASLVNAGVTVTQTFSYTVSSTGVYSRTLQIQTDINNYQTTDAWGWDPVVSVVSAPSAFNLLYPDTNATDVSPTPTFSWESASGSASGATGYRFEIKDEWGLWFRSVLVGNTTNFAYDQTLNYGQDLYWRVFATNTVGETRSTDDWRKFTVQPLAPLNVTGRWLYTRTAFNKTVTNAVRFARVELYDNEPSPLAPALIAVTNTDENGYFQFSGIPNNDGPLEGGVDLFCKVYTDYGLDTTKCARVGEYQLINLPPNDCVAHKKDSAVIGDCTGGDIDFGGTIIKTNKAFGIYDDAVTAYDFFKSASPSHANSKIYIFYPDNTPIGLIGEACATLVGGTLGSYWHPLGNFIGIQTTDPDNWLVFHEYAHAVMYGIYGEAFWPGGVPHTFTSEVDPKLAMAEGWADFVAQLLSFSESGFEHRWFSDSIGGNGGAKHYADVVDTQGLLGYECDGTNIEGSVAEVFWDIADGGPADDDAINSDFNSIMAVLSQFHPQNITDFKTGYLSLYSDRQSALRDIYQIAKIERSSDIIPPQAVTGLQATFVTNRFDLSWVAAPDADVSGYVCFKKNGNPQNNGEPLPQSRFCVGEFESGMPANNNEVVYVGSANSFTDTNVLLGTEYSYTIYAYDTSYNYSTGISVSAIASPEPDFVVTDIALDPSSPTAGTPFSAVVTVKNQGASAGDGGWLDVWTHQPTPVAVGDDGAQSWRVNSLAVNESRAFTFTNLQASLDPGEYVFRAYVDSQGNTLETDEGNNQFTLSYTLSAGNAYSAYLAAGERALLSKPILFNGTKYQVVGITTQSGVATFENLFNPATYWQPPLDQDDPYLGSEASTIELFMPANPSFLVQYWTNGTWAICSDEATRAWIYHLSRAQVQANYRHNLISADGVYSADPSHYDGSLHFRDWEALWFPTCWMLYAPILGDDDQQRYRQAAFEQPLQRYITHGQLSLFSEGYIPLPNGTDFSEYQEKVMDGAIDAAKVINFSKRRWQYFPPELAAARTSIGQVSTAWDLYQDMKDILVLHVLDADKVLLMNYIRDHATGVVLDADFVAALDGYITNKSDLVNQQLDNIVNFSIQYVQDEVMDYAVEKASAWLIAKCIQQGYTSAHALTISGVSLSASQVLGIELVVAGLVIDVVANPEGVYEQRIVSHYAAKNARNWEIIGSKLAGDIATAAEIDEVQADAYLMLEMMEREIYGNLCQNLVAATDASFAGGAAAGWASLLTPDQWRWTRGTAISWEYAQQHWNDVVRYMIGRTRSQPLPPAELAAPTVTITSPTSSSSYSTSVSSITLSGSATDDVGVVSVSWRVTSGPAGNGTGTGAWTSGPIALTRGTNVITVTAWDAAGKAGTDTLSVTYTPPDTQSPQIVISYPTSGPTYETGVSLVSLSGTATDDGVMSSATWVNSRGGSGSCILSGNSVAAQNISLAEGDNVITITVWDASGKSGSDTLTVLYTAADTQAPTVTIEYPVPVASFTTSVNKVSLGGSSTDDRSLTSVGWSNNRGGSGSCNGTTSWSVFDIPLLSGENVLTITASDGAGHTGSDTLTVTYSTIIQSGAVQCSITPAAAVSAGATWRIDSGPWQPSGNVVSGVSTGQHVVSFSTANGWTTPGAQAVAVTANQTNVLAATYTLGTPCVLDLATLFYAADETNGTAVADSVGANGGTVDDVNELYFSYSAELHRFCLKKEDSTTAGLTPASAPVTNPTFTVSCWAKPAPENDPASGAFFLVNSNPEKSYRIFTDRINYQYSDYGSYPQRTGTFTADGGWHHYAWVNTDNGDGTARLRMFVDGAKLLDDTLSASEYNSTVSTSEKFLVQRPLSAFYYQFIGEICEIAVFDGSALSDTQVQGVYIETDPRPNNASDFTYTTNNGAITITGYPGSGSGGAVTIPGTINGLPVASIGTNAFYYCTNLTGIVIPNSVTNIGSSAFRYCFALTNALIGNSVINLGSYAFWNCYSLASVFIPAGVTNIGNYAFAVCGVDVITVDPLNAFYCSVDGVLFNKSQTTLIQCSGDKAGNYEVPASVTTIRSYAFSACEKLTDVTIPASVTSIGSYVFEHCSSLTNITVNAANAGYSSADGILFNKSRTLLSTCPEGKAGSYAIPGSVISISGYAFRHCTNLTIITIPDSVISIGRSSFDYNTGLTSVTIPDSVKNIGDSAFSRCSSLASVTIGGGITNIGNWTFSSCTNLTGVYFLGNAPAVGSSVFSGDNKATIYRTADATGWPPVPDLWAGRPTALWQPDSDVDADGIPALWEVQYFGGTTNANPSAICANGINTVIEAYIVGLNPTDPNAAFLTSILPGKVLQWNAVSGRVYDVYWTTNLLTGFQCLESNIPWTRSGFTNSSSVPCGYYKIDVQLEN